MIRTYLFPFKENTIEEATEPIYPATVAGCVAVISPMRWWKNS